MCVDFIFKIHVVTGLSHRKNNNMLFLRFEVRKVTPAVGEFTIELEDEYPDISHLHCCCWSNLVPAMYFSKNPCAGAPSFFGPLRY